MIKDILFDSDISFTNGDITTEQTLYNLYQFSIFTDKNKFWADRNLGSQIYKLSNEIINEQTLLEIELYITDSIQWIKDDGLVAKHTLNVFQDDTSVKFTIDSILPDGSKYKIGWEIT